MSYRLEHYSSDREAIADYIDSLNLGSKKFEDDLAIFDRLFEQVIIHTTKTIGISLVVNVMDRVVIQTAREHSLLATLRIDGTTINLSDLHLHARPAVLTALSQLFTEIVMTLAALSAGVSDSSLDSLLRLLAPAPGNQPPQR